MQHAKTHLSALIAEVERGATITIARGDHPVARLVPIGAPPARELGFVAYRLPDSFFEPLPDDQLQVWEA